MPERATWQHGARAASRAQQGGRCYASLRRCGKSAEAVVAAGMEQRAEREGVPYAMSMREALRQMPATAGRVPIASGEAARVRTSDEATRPRHETGSTGSALLLAALTRENLQQAWKRVKANKGAAGVDGRDIPETARYLQTEWSGIREQLLQGTYRPSPVRRVTIPKPAGGERELGIPTVTDRLIQQALLQVLQPILDPTFSEYSYGFRPGRSAQEAVVRAQAYVQSGCRIVVDVAVAGNVLRGRAHGPGDHVAGARRTQVGVSPNRLIACLRHVRGDTAWVIEWRARARGKDIGHREI